MIEIKNLTRSSINEKRIKEIAGNILKSEKRGEETVSIVIVGEKKIKRINRDYRKKDKITDVLSFILKDDSSLSNELILGEIFICPKWIKKKKENLDEVIMHGILHLLGYDHEKEKEEEVMKRKEDYYKKIIESKKWQDLK